MHCIRRIPKAGYETAALQTSERARARSLLELLSGLKLIYARASPTTFLRENAHCDRRSTRKPRPAPACSVIHRRKRKPCPSTKRSRNNERLRKSKSRFAEAARITALTQPQPLTAIQIQQLLDEDTVLLEFAIGEKHSWLWTIARSSMEVYQLPQSRRSNPLPAKFTNCSPRDNRELAKLRHSISPGSMSLELSREIRSAQSNALGQIAAKLSKDGKAKGWQ